MKKYAIVITVVMILLMTMTACADSTKKNTNLVKNSMDDNLDYVIKFAYQPISKKLDSIKSTDSIQPYPYGIADLPMSEEVYIEGYEKLLDIEVNKVKEIEISIGSELIPTILKVSDGYIIGVTENINNLNYTSSTCIPLIYKIDFAGNIMWEKELEAIKNGSSMNNLFVFNNGDIGFTITMYPTISRGNASSNGNNGKTILWKGDCDGNLIFKKEYEDYCGELMKYVMVTKKDTLLSVGVDYKNDNYQLVLMEIEADGEITNKKWYGGDGGADFCNGVKYDEQIGLIVTGWTNATKSELIVENFDKDRTHYDYIACFDKELNLNWVKNTITNERYNYEQLTIVDHDIYICGNNSKVVEEASVSSYQSTISKSFLIKYNSSGQEVYKIYEDKALLGANVICVLSNNQVVLSSGNMNSGWVVVLNQNGEKIKKIETPFVPNEIVARTAGGFIVKSIRKIKLLPQIIYSSMGLMDTEVVVTKYDNELNIIWRQTYNDYQDTVKIDQVYLTK